MSALPKKSEAMGFAQKLTLHRSILRQAIAWGTTYCGDFEFLGKAEAMDSQQCYRTPGIMPTFRPK
jgi:hypothetical protein